MDDRADEIELSLIGKREELLKCTEAEAALRNPAIVEYFADVRDTALSALLTLDTLEDKEAMWRLRTIAKVTSELFECLKETRDQRAYVEMEIKALEQRKTLNE